MISLINAAASVSEQIRRSLLLLFLLSPLTAAERPNILFILTDDLGTGDLARFDTPHLDRLAGEGLTFTQAYAPAPICSASRAAILTGNSTARNHFEFVVKKEAGVQEIPDTALQSPPFTINLALDATTIPEALSEAGYDTAFFGKWHLNAHHERYLGWSPTHGPKAQGFATAVEDFGSHPYSYWNRKKLRSFTDVTDGEYIPDGVTDRAIAYLESPRENPFFLLLSHFYVHDPIHTRLKWLHDQTEETEPELGHYGAMVTTLDYHVGEVLDALDQSGQREDTLVVFLSDNGGHPNYAGNAPLRGSKWNLYEGGIRVPMIARWPGEIPADTETEAVVSGIDLFSTFTEIAGTDSPTVKDGRSLLSLFRNPQSKPPERELVWHFPYYHPETNYDTALDEIGIDDGATSKTKPHSAIRRGDWKLVHFYEDDRDELYQLPDETTELSSENPEQAEILRSALDSYLEKVGARLPAAK